MLLEEAVDKTEVLVVGAGPAGLITAREAALRGVKVMVVEEHYEIGVPSHCAGLLSVDGLRTIGIVPTRRFVQNEVMGARFHSPEGMSFTIRGGKKRAYVVDRSVFDKLLADQAARAGVELRLGFRARSLALSNKLVLGVRGEGNKVLGAKIVVDAEGSVCQLLKKAGFATPALELMLPAVQFEVVNVEVDPDFVDIFLGQKVAPGFFAWIIPAGGDSARIGLACKNNNPYQLLQRFIKERVGRYQTISIRAGHVLTCGPSSKTYGNGLLTVGDAAGQTKPTTGGGVITGGICAKIAGETAAEAVGEGDVSANFLRKYERMWKKTIGNELSTMRTVRKIANNLSDETIDRIFQVVIQNNLKEIIEENGDIDFQSTVFRRLARHPSILKLLASILGDLIFR